MKPKTALFPRSYSAALGRYLQEGLSSNLEPARKLGLQAVRNGLETLELAKMHEQALISLLLPEYSLRLSNTMIRRAGVFFAEVIIPIESTHPGAKQVQGRLKITILSLSQRSLELARSSKKLEKEIVQRKKVEECLRASEQISSELLRKSLLMQEELRQLSRRLLSIQEEERKRVSRELHDVFAQAFMSINSRLAALQTLSTTKATDIQKTIEGTQRLIEKSVDRVHRFARDLRPSVLDDLGLIPALHAHLKDFMEQTGIRVALTAFADLERLDNASRIVLYRVAQEALTNVARHAQASRASVTIREKSGSVCMEIHDNGRGFPADGADSANRKKRLGLLGMRERVEMIGGTFCIASAPGKMTTICVEIPKGGGKSKSAPPKSRNTTLPCP